MVRATLKEIVYKLQIREYRRGRGKEGHVCDPVYVRLCDNMALRVV